MLTERFVASTGTPTKAPKTSLAKDAGVFIYELQPLAAQRAFFKKSTTRANSLAVSDSHIFAAQLEKGVVHVYSREKGSHEATVPFTEKITCIALACDDTVLLLGTAEGRLLLWEVCTGRQVTTHQNHLQAVTCLTVDPTGNLLLSGSVDSTVHIWSLPSLLSFSTSPDDLVPLQTFTSHRTEVTAVVVGHSAGNCNISISASKDNTCFVWDYKTCNVLRTYLLPGEPLCLALDPADRAAYVGYEDGTLQALDLYTSPTIMSNNTSAIHGNHIAGDLGPVQPPASSRWTTPETAFGSTLSIGVSYDGYTVLSGHQSGDVLSWDVARGAFGSKFTLNPLSGPITNLSLLPVTGFGDSIRRKLVMQNVVKPRFGAYDSPRDGAVPGNYTLAAGLAASLERDAPTLFERALTQLSFPSLILEDGLADLATRSQSHQSNATNGTPEETEPEEFVPLDGAPEKGRQLTLQEQNINLRMQLDAMRRVQDASFDRIEKIDAERKALVKVGERRLQKKIAKLNGIGLGCCAGTGENEAMADDLDSDLNSESAKTGDDDEDDA